MTLLDEVMTWAGILTMRKVCVAAELTVRLKRPVTAGQRIRVEGWIGEAKARLVTAHGRVLDGEGRELAAATGKYVPMPAADAPLCVKDFVDSPDALRLPFLDRAS
jgi:acyl-coenzyme A thioesterase PaaI-like protein